MRRSPGGNSEGADWRSAGDEQSRGHSQLCGGAGAYDGNSGWGLGGPIKWRVVRCGTRGCLVGELV